MIVAVVPVFNEAPTIAAIVARVAAFCPVVVVDDASTDASAERALAAGPAALVRHPRRRGKGAALRTGFAAALARGATSVVTLDGDGQHDPADLPRLAAAARRAPGALVVGDRLGDAAGDGMPRLRRQAIRAADGLVGWLARARVRDTQCGFRIYPASFLRDVVLREEGFVLETEVLVRAARAGYPVVSVPVRCIYLPGRQSRFRTLADAGRIAWYLAREAAGTGRRPLGTGR